MNAQIGAVCPACQDVITNPICVGCLQRGMAQWLSEKKPELLPLLEVDDRFESDTWCVVCKGYMTICAHCYCGEIYESIKEKDNELAEEFLDRYDFELTELT